MKVGSGREKSSYRLQDVENLLDESRLKWKIENHYDSELQIQKGTWHSS